MLRIILMFLFLIFDNPISTPTPEFLKQDLFFLSLEVVIESGTKKFPFKMEKKLLLKMLLLLCLHFLFLLVNNDVIFSVNMIY